ncbi:MAG: phosphotransferase [Acidimicrobiia bacterium]|nr:phosphotransferase [Acidimicrobiia bacterium]
MGDAVAAPVDVGGSTTGVVVGRRRYRWTTPAHHAELDLERDRLDWLVGRAGTPVVIEAGRDDRHHWLVTERVSGSPASSGEHAFDAIGTVAATATAIRALHDLVIDGCPFSLRLDVTLDRARGRIDDGALGPNDLDPAFRRFSPRRLFELVNESPPDEIDLVVCHGMPSLDTILIDRGNAAGLIGLEACGVADRHLDLALIARDLLARIGPDALPVFFDAYGADPDAMRIDWYLQLAQLL